MPVRNTKNLATDARMPLKSLKDFYDKHGHVHIPNVKGHAALYRLCDRIRKKKINLTKKEISDLDRMAFMWTVRSSNDLRWHYHFGELKAFWKQFGHTRVPPRQEPYRTLGTWVLRQRRDRKRLSPDCVKLLNSVGFEWSAQIRKAKDEQWRNMFSRLQSFFKIHRHSNVPDRYKSDEKLGRWVSTVRYGKDRLEDWKKLLLRRVRFKFSDDIRKDREDNRRRLFRNIETFFKKNGHANVPETYHDSKLAVAVAYLRQYPERISPAEKRKLKSWKFLFSEDIKQKWDQLWEKSFQKLTKFKKQFGHCRVSSAYVDKGLARWVANQRKDEQDGKLPEKRYKKLLAVGFAFYKDIAALHEKKWLEMYKKLLSFKQRFGSTLVKEGYKDKRLAYWVQHQRQGKAKMSNERKKLLDDAGFVWRVK